MGETRIPKVGEGEQPKSRATVAVQNRTLQPEPKPAPRRAPSLAREHTFYDVESLGRYLGKYKTEDTVVTADVKRLIFKAVLNEVAQQGREALYLHCRHHPLFVPWAELLDCGQVPVGQLLTVIAANRRAISEPEPKELLLTLSQLRGATKVALDVGTPQANRPCINGLVVTSEVSTAHYVEIPESITVEAPLFIGRPPVVVILDLVLQVANENTVTVTVTSSDLERLKVSEFEDMLVQLNEVPGIIVGMGSLEYREWLHLPDA